MYRLCDLDIWHVKVKLFRRTDYDPICIKDFDLDLYEFGELVFF